MSGRQSECAVIGAVLREPALLADERVRDLGADDFAEDDTRALWAVIRRLHAAGEHVDAVTVSESPAGRALAANCWAMVADCYSTANAATYAERIREAARERRERAAALNLAEALRRGDREAAERLRVELSALRKTATEGADVPAADVALHCAAGLRMQPVRWLWPGWLARGKLHIVGGAPGTGKTTLALALAATITTAGRWPDGTDCRQAGDVLLWSGEDDPADTLLPRLAAAGADLTRVHIVGDVHDPDGRRPFDPARDMPGLYVAAGRIGTVRLLIVDPIVSAVATDSHKNGEVRRALQPLVDFGHRRGAAVLGVTHFSKGTAGRDPLERLTGSLAFGALARIVYGAAKVRSEGPEDGSTARRVFARLKSNIGPDGGGFAYALEVVELAEGASGSRVTWGEAIEGTAREILTDADSEPDTGDADERTERDEAADWLRDVLADGPLTAADLKLLAQRNGIAWRTVRRAKDALGVQSKKGAMRGGWTWQLPEGVQGGHEGAEGVHPEKAGHLGRLRQDVDTFGEREEGDL